MTFKTLMISAATAAMVAGGAFAESHSTATETEAETTQEMQTETSNDTTSTDAGMSGEAESAVEDCDERHDAAPDARAGDRGVRMMMDDV